MSAFWNLVKNENMKIYRAKRTWILFVVLLGLIIGVGIYHQQNEPQVETDQWQQQAKQDIKKESAGSKAAYTDSVAKLQYGLKHDINPYERNNWWFTNEVPDEMLFVVTLFVVIIVSDIVASEFSWGSIKMLMVRPHRRWSILLSKYLTSIFTVLSFSLGLFVLSWLVGGVIFGFSGFDFITLKIEANEITEKMASVHALQIYGLNVLYTVMVMTIAFMLSTIFRSGGLAIGVSIVVYYSGDAIATLLARYDWSKYVIFENIDLSAYLSHPDGVMNGMSLSFSLVVDLIYWLVFLILTGWIFMKRDIST